MINTDFLATYYQEAAFVRWISSNNFQAITVDNVGRYYSLYLRHRMCEELRCHECPGMKPMWTSEHEIHTGRFTQRACATKQALLDESSSTAVLRQFTMPKVFESAGFDLLTKIDPKAMTAIKEYIIAYPKKTTPGLYLYSGERRIGRSAALWCILRELVMARKIHADYLATTGPMFAELIIADAIVDGHPYFNQAKNCDLLMIDDFGVERFTDGYTDRLLAILESRYWNMRPVLVSSTKPLSDWAWAEGREPLLLSKLESMTNCIRLDTAEMEII